MNEKDKSLLERYQKYNRMGGIAAAAGEMGGIIMNLSDKQKTRSNFTPVKKIAPETINLKAPDIKTQGTKDIEKAYATGLKSMNESGGNNYEGMLGQTINALQELSMNQANINTQIGNQNQMFNAEARIKAEMTNADIDRMNQEAIFQRDQFKFQTDSLYNTNIMKGIANTTNILSSIQMKDMMAEIELERNRAYMDSLTIGTGNEIIQDPVKPENVFDPTSFFSEMGAEIGFKTAMGSFGSMGRSYTPKGNSSAEKAPIDLAGVTSTDSLIGDLFPEWEGTLEGSLTVDEYKRKQIKMKEI
jgi:hypothetical protein